MSLPADLTRLTADEVVQLVALHTFELNLLIRYLAVTGRTVHADVVDRDDAIYYARPEIVLNVI